MTGYISFDRERSTVSLIVDGQPLLVKTVPPPRRINGLRADMSEAFRIRRDVLAYARRRGIEIVDPPQAGQPFGLADLDVR